MLKKIISTFSRSPTPFPDVAMGQAWNPDDNKRWADDISAAMDRNLLQLEQFAGSVERRVDLITQDVAELPCEVAVTEGQVCQLSVNGKMIPADASDKVYARGLIGLAIRDNAGNIDGRFLLRGFYDSTDFDAGDILYLSETEGTMTASMPTTSGSIVRIVGYKLANDKIFFNPDTTYIEVE